MVGGGSRLCGERRPCGDLSRSCGGLPSCMLHGICCTACCFLYVVCCTACCMSHVVCCTACCML
jgi:hypothetical protein